MIDEAGSPPVTKNIASLAAQNNSGHLNISSSLNQKNNVATSASKNPEESPDNFDEDTDTGSNDKKEDLDLAPTLDSKVDTDNNGDPTNESARQTETEQNDIDTLDSDKDKEHDQAVPGNDSEKLANDDGDLSKDNTTEQNSVSSPIDEKSDQKSEEKGNDEVSTGLDKEKDNAGLSLDNSQNDNNDNELKDYKDDYKNTATYLYKNY